MAGTSRRKGTTRKPGTIPKVSSPLSSGDYGGRFQDRVDGWILAQLLMRQQLDAVPGIVTRATFQRRIHGALLDDTVVETDAGFEVQLSIKVGAAFTAGNADFRDTVMLAWAMHLAGKWTGIVVPPHIPGFATMRQLVFLGRQHDSTTDFERAIETPGAIAERDRIAALRSILDEAAKHKLSADEFHAFLRTFVVVGLDFDIPPHKDEAAVVTILASERGITRDEAQTLFGALTTMGEEFAIASAGVEVPGLERRLREKNVVAGLAANLRPYRSILAHYTERAFESTLDTVAGVRLDRADLVAGVLEALNASHDVVVAGPSGFGKSTVIRRVVEQLEMEGAVLNLSGPRLEFAGSWPSLAAEIGVPADRRLLGDLLATHPRGMTVVIDAIEHVISPAARTMLTDLLRELGARTEKRNVVIGARSSALTNLDWIDPAKLRPLEQIEIAGPTDDDLVRIAAASPILGELIARSPNPFPGGLKLLSMLHDSRISQAALRKTAATESDLLDLWWKRVLVGSTNEGQDRFRIVLAAAEAAITESSGFFDLPLNATGAVLIGLIRDGVLVYDDDLNRYRFGHDAIQDWAIVNWLAHRPDDMDDRLRRVLAVPGYYRAVSLLAQRLAERDSERYVQMRDAVAQFPDQRGANAFLTALVLSPRAPELFVEYRDDLFAGNGEKLSMLLNIVASEQVDVHVDLLERLRKQGLSIGEAISFAAELSPPRWLVWLPLIGFCVNNIHALAAAFTPFLKLAARWQATTGAGVVHRRGILDAAIATLTFLERWRPKYVGQTGPHVLYAERDGVETLAREIVADSVDVDREWVTTYLRDLVASGYGDDQDDMLRHLPKLSESLTDEIVAFGSSVLIEDDAEPGEADFAYLGVRTMLYIPASDAQGPFLPLLRKNEEAGLALARALAKRATAKYEWRIANAHYRPLTFTFHGKTCTFGGDGRVYTWFRPWAHDSDVLTSALMAVDTWAYESIASGREPREIVELLLADDAPLPFLGIAAGLIYDFPRLLLDFTDLVAQPWYWRLEDHRYRGDRMPDDFNEVLPAEFQMPAYAPHDRMKARNRARDARRNAKRDVESLAQALLFGSGTAGRRAEFLATAAAKELVDATLWREEEAFARDEPDSEALTETRRDFAEFARVANPESYEIVDKLIMFRWPETTSEIAEIIAPPSALAASLMTLAANKMLREYRPPYHPANYDKIGKKFAAMAVAPALAEDLRASLREGELRCACVATAFAPYSPTAATEDISWSHEQVMRAARDFDAADWNEFEEDVSGMDVRVIVATALGGVFASRPNEPEVRRLVFRLARRIELLEVLRGLLRGLIPMWQSRSTGPLAVLSLMLDAIVRDHEGDGDEVRLASVDADELAGLMPSWPSFDDILRPAIARMAKVISTGPRRITDPAAIATIVPLVEALLDVSDGCDDDAFCGEFRDALGIRAATVLAGITTGYDALRARLADWERAPEVCANVIASTIHSHFTEDEFTTAVTHVRELTVVFFEADHSATLARNYLTREFRDLCWVAIMVRNFEGVIVPEDAPSLAGFEDYITRWARAIGAHPENLRALLTFLSRFAGTFAASQVVAWLHDTVTRMPEQHLAQMWREQGTELAVTLLRLVTERPSEMRANAAHRAASRLAEELLVQGVAGSGELRAALDSIYRP